MLSLAKIGGRFNDFLNLWASQLRRAATSAKEYKRSEGYAHELTPSFH
jgi:hypothetical protein